MLELFFSEVLEVLLVPTELREERDEELLTPLVPPPLTPLDEEVPMVVPLKEPESSCFEVGLLIEPPAGVRVPLPLAVVAPPLIGLTEEPVVALDEPLLAVLLLPFAICVPPRPPRRSL